MPEPEDSEASTRIAKIQRTTDQAIRLAAIQIEKLGGPNAVDGYLNQTLCNLLGVAITEQGVDGACELMLVGLQTAEEYAHKNRC